MIEHFRDKERRQEFFKEYKEVEMLYEIISPDAFLRPYLDAFATLSSIYAIVRNAYAKTLYVDRAFQYKTNALVQRHVGAVMERPQQEFIALDSATLAALKARGGGDASKVVNLVRSIEKAAEEQSGDPFLVALADRARLVRESFEERQVSTAEALAALVRDVEDDDRRKQEQAARGLDDLSHFVLRTLTDERIANAEHVAGKVTAALARWPNWRRSEGDLREARKLVTYALYAVEEDLDRMTAMVETLFDHLTRVRDR